MDPITQGLLGAAATQVVLGDRLGRRAWLYGAIGGMAADLDILIRSDDDPLMALKYHRHFTHSLSFIPIGGVLSALPFMVSKRDRARKALVAAGTTVGYATHALLDAFTSYGTMLWWPFSSARVAWSWIAIIDPIFTGALAFGVIVSARRRNARPAAFALLFAALYLAWGGLQHHRALGAAEALAQERGHEPTRMEAFPTSASNVVWRTLYETGDTIYVDEARTPWFAETQSRAGGSVPHLEADDLGSEIRSDPDAVAAFETFAWFADRWVARSPGDPEQIGDLRYGLKIAGLRSMWGIALEPGNDPPVSRWQERPDVSEALSRRWSNLVSGTAD